MDIQYFSPSYKRPYKSITQFKYPFVKLVIAESEAEEYEKGGNDFITCPDSVQGNLARVRNWILNEFADSCDCVVIIDDDCDYLAKWVNQERQILTPDELIEFAENATQMSLDYGIKLWGINSVDTKLAYRESVPFSFIAHLPDTFMGHVKPSLRFDEKLFLKQNYDFTLQNLLKYRSVLRFNAYHLKVKQGTQTGGCANVRNINEEKKQFEMLSGGR